MLVYRHSLGIKSKPSQRDLNPRYWLQTPVGLWLRDLRRELFRRPVIICAFNPFHFIGK